MGKNSIGTLLLIIVLCIAFHPQNLHADDIDRPLAGTAIGSDQNGRSWVGLDLGTPHVITSVRWCKHTDAPTQSSVMLGLFEGSNREDFMDAIPLYMITEEGTAGEDSYALVQVTRGFRYVRWVAPADMGSDIADVDFYGYAGQGNDTRFYQLTNLPTLSYHTYSGIEPYDKVHELESEMCIIYDGGTRLQEYPILARERGNGSRYELFKKRPYRIKFNDGKSHHMLKDSPLESPAKAKKWTLIPNWRDKSLMRNNVAFEMSRRLGLSYTPWIQNVDVIVNGQYKGNYQLCDQVTVDRHRVEITDMQSGDIDETSITGGYLLEITSPGGETYHFSSDRGIPVDIKSPDKNDIATEQFSYIRAAFYEMESRLWADNYQDAEEGYRSRLDLESFLRLFLVGEFSGNNDAMWSVYLYKEREDDSFRFGPVWDFDLSMDNDRRTYPANGKPNWLYNYGAAVTGIRDFVSRILSDPYANQMLYEIWSGMRESGAFSRDSLWAFVDSLGCVMDASQKLNFTRWDNLDQLLTLQQFAPGTYQGELDIIKNYLQERINWIDEKLGYIHYEEVDPSDTLFVISSPADLLAFQHAVNSQGLASLNGRLAADLDLSSISPRLEPIGTADHPYVGTFDGQGHTISRLTMELDKQYVGLFGIVSGGATIKNFVLDETCSISGKTYVGIIGGSDKTGTITMECLGNEGSVTAATRYAGGIFGCNNGGAATPVFRNCYVTGTVKGGRKSGQITGYAGNNARAYNCYACGSIDDVYQSDMSDAMWRGNPQSFNCYSTYPDKNATVIVEGQVASGELCYMLNQGDGQDAPVWYQTLGRDGHPMLQHHLEVILQGNEYANKFDFALSNPQDVTDFALLVESGLTDINGIVTDDLDFQDITITPIGTADHPYVGCFDGQGHTFSNLVVKSGGNFVGLFGIVSGGAVIKNFVLDESCSISGGSYVGIIGGSKGSGTITMECLGNEGSTTASERNAGGIFGCNMSAASTPIFRNCYVSGPVKGGRESGQITGYAARGQAYNCYGSGTIEGYYYQDGSDAMLRGNPQSFNCYSTYPDRNATVVDETQVTDGELCYMLNQGDDQDTPVWYQTLGQDDHPVLDGTHQEVHLAPDGSYINWDMDLLSAPFWAAESESYSLWGLPMSKSEKGIHIIRTPDGKSRKVLVK